MFSNLRRAAEPALYSRAAKEAKGGPLSQEAEEAIGRWRLREVCAAARRRDCWEEVVEAAHAVRVRMGELQEDPYGYVYHDVGVLPAMVAMHMSRVREAYAEMTRRGEAAVGFQDLLRIEIALRGVCMRSSTGSSRSRRRGLTVYGRSSTAYGRSSMWRSGGACMGSRMGGRRGSGRDLV